MPIYESIKAKIARFASASDKKFTQIVTYLEKELKAANVTAQEILDFTRLTKFRKSEATFSSRCLAVPLKNNVGKVRRFA